MKIKKGDTVVILTGKDKGKEGKVLRTFKDTEKVLVEDIAIAMRHQKATRRGSAGQIVARPMPIHVSNVALKDAKTGKASRVGFVFEGEGKDRKKVRITKASGEKA